MKFTSSIPSLLAIAISLSFVQRTEGQGFAENYLQRTRAQNSASRYTINRFRNEVTSRAYGRAGVAGVNLRNFSNSSSFNPRSKPFSSLNRGPSVTPYLALNNSFNQVSDYYNIVRPQQDFQRDREQQQRENVRVQSQIRANEHRLNQIAARAPFELEGDPGLAPTGHAATYMHFQNFQSTGAYFTPIQGLEKQR